MLHVNIVSLFPEFFDSPLSCGLMARARNKKIIDFTICNPRDHSDNKHHHVDDRPFGGGPGMVMQIPPLASAMRSIPEPGRILLLTPQGYPFDQSMAQSLAQEKNITLVCGRYEGIDGRLGDFFPLTPVSVGEVVLNGGEAAALTVIDAVARLCPGFMGKEASGEDESFAQGLLEYPHYTRPEIFEGVAAPEELLTGNHANIDRWRRQQALIQTWRYRPDLLDTAPLTCQDAEVLQNMPRTHRSRNLSFCLVHHPVQIDGKKSGISSLTNLDIHDIARISTSYGLGNLYVVTPLQDQQVLLRELVHHWTTGRVAKQRPDRAQALACIRLVDSLEDAITLMTTEKGTRPFVVASSASWPRGKKAPAPMVAQNIRKTLGASPVLLCLGTAQGLSEAALNACDALLRPLRFLDYNHLSVRSAAAIFADRILGDFM